MVLPSASAALPVPGHFQCRIGIRMPAHEIQCYRPGISADCTCIFPYDSFSFVVCYPVTEIVQTGQIPVTFTVSVSYSCQVLLEGCIAGGMLFVTQDQSCNRFNKSSTIQSVQADNQILIRVPVIQCPGNIRRPDKPFRKNSARLLSAGKVFAASNSRATFMLSVGCAIATFAKATRRLIPNI